MEGPPLRLPTPFGKGMISVAGRLRRALLKQHITPTQTDGEMLLAMCYAQKDDLPAWVDTFSHLMLGDDLCSWVTQEVGWTEDFRWICNLALEEVTPPIEDEDREATSNALAFLLKEVTRRPRTLGGLRRTDNWSLFYQQPPSLPAPVARWRLGSRGNSRRQIPSPNGNLRKNFDWSGLRGSFPCWLLSLTRSPTWPRSWARTKKENGLSCWVIPGSGPSESTVWPWKTSKHKDSPRFLGQRHLNRMRAEEASPHKIQGVWETLRWFSKRFGFLKIDACERLMEKKKTLQEEGVDTVARPQRKAILPTKEVIWTLEEVAAGPGPAPAQSGEGPSPVELLDQYICGVVRFQVACSARFNDLQHTIPTAYKFHGGTIELQAWQTKTVSAFRSKKSPVPLLAPTYSFTGRDWWTPLMRTWDKMKDLEKFKDLDFIIPTLSKDSTGIIPRPSAADRALRWLNAALHRNWSTVSSPDILHKLTWHSFRVFVPDCAYQLGFPRDQRQYLGNWTTETTADIYTRDKRNVVEKVWKAVGDKMGILKLDNPQAERRIDLNHEDWDDVVDVEDEPRRQLNLDDLDTPMAEPSHLADASEGTFKRRKHTPPSTGNSSWSLISGGQELPPPLGPLRVVSASNKSPPVNTLFTSFDRRGRQLDVDGNHRQPRPWTFLHRISSMTWTPMPSATDASRSIPSLGNGMMR